MLHFASAHAGSGAERAGFGRLFPRRAPRWAEPELEALAATMVETPGGRGPALGMPAGYTYLAQFIDHDLSSDARRFQRPPGDTVANERTAGFDLDSLYGGGPNSADAALYTGHRLRLDASDRDLVRRDDGQAYVKDRRNDSNRVLSQLHVAFARFHNRVVDALGPGSRHRFDQARSIVRRHYQWVVRHDFLPRLVGTETVANIVGPGGDEAPERLRCVAPGAAVAMPLEFSAAAFRFGHSMVRGAYQLRTDGGAVLLFDTGRPEGHDAIDLRGFRPLSAEAVIDWALFFPLDAAVKPQRARPIDTMLARPLAELPVALARDRSVPGRRLAFRNLHRGEIDLGLPTGQEVARALRRRGVPLPATLLGDDALPVALSEAAAIQLVGTRRSVMDQRLQQQGTPLWYYVLKEAELLGEGGTRLGPVAGRIVAETMFALLLSDPLGIEHSGWRPTPGQFGCRADNGEFGIAELLKFALVKG